MRWKAELAALALMAGLSACVVKQPDWSYTWVELPISLPAERADLLAILHNAAEAPDLHVDDVSPQYASFSAEIPDLDPCDIRAASLSVGVWQGRDGKDENMVASVTDRGMQGAAWVYMAETDHPELVAAAQERLLKALQARWPDARVVVGDNGAPFERKCVGRKDAEAAPGRPPLAG
jgi:hypothetical protein